MSWNPTDYLGFGSERLRPAVELLNRCPLESPKRIADLGCGPGNATALLARRWPNAEILGIDSSAEMLAEAGGGPVRARWIAADIAAWEPDAPQDLIFSNAALHWLDRHEDLFPRLMAMLAPGGLLAVQMPRNFAAPSHALLREVAADPRWRDRLSGVLRADPAWEPEAYHDLLAPVSPALDIWQTEYLHVLLGEDAVLRWVRGTALTPVAAALGEDAFAEFEAVYREHLRDAYPMRSDGATLFPFKRLFIVAGAEA